MGTTKTRALAVASLMAAAAFGLTACTSVQFDESKLRAAIEDQAGAQGVELTELSCPDSPEMKAGNEFECDASFDNGQEGTILVTVDDDSGNVTWVLQ